MLSISIMGNVTGRQTSNSDVAREETRFKSYWCSMLRKRMET